mgnify:CR=1 FL=1
MPTPVIKPQTVKSMIQVMDNMDMFMDSQKDEDFFKKSHSQKVVWNHSKLGPPLG